MNKHLNKNKSVTAFVRELLKGLIKSTMGLIAISFFLITNCVYATVPESNQKLITALENLRDASYSKIDNDTHILATTFTQTRSVEQGITWAYIFKTPLYFILETINDIGELLDLASVVTDFQNISSYKDAAKFYLTTPKKVKFWAELVDRQRATTEDLQFAISGYSYTTDVKTMLDAADSKACGFLCITFGSSAYSSYYSEIKKYLENPNGVNYIAIPLTTNELNQNGTRRRVYRVVQGSSALKAEINKRVQRFINSLNSTPLVSNFPIDTVIADLNKMTNDIKANALRDYKYYATLNNNQTFLTKLRIGSFPTYWAPFSQAMADISNDLLKEQVQIAIDSVDSIVTLTSIYLDQKGGTSKTVEKRLNVSSSTISAISELYSVYSQVTQTNAKDQIHEIPQEMLYVLPNEWASLWTLLDDHINDVEKTIDSPIVLSSNLKINPSAPFEGQALNAEFTVTNNVYGVQLELAARCYLNGNLDSTYVPSSISISGGGSYTHKGTVTPGRTGNYKCYAEYRQDLNEGWKKMSSALGLQNVLDITVNKTATLPSTTYNFSQYIADITIPDGTTLTAGQSFTKTWRLKNAGNTTWNSNYKLAYVSGNQMSGPASVSVPTTASPGSTVDLSVNLAAPSTSGGPYYGYWQMKDPNGALFGEKIYVKIMVGSNTVAPPAEGDLIRAIGTDRIYLVKGGRKWWINSPSMFTAMGYLWGNVKDYPSTVIDSIQYGPVIVADGSLIRQQGDTKVFLIQNDQRRWITSVAAFIAGGYNWNDVMDVPPSIISMFPLGSDISDKPRVLVASPNGGETFIRGSSYNILWSASDDVGVSYVSIFYSIDGGATWVSLAMSLSNNGNYAWTPMFTAASVKVKVVAYDSSGLSGEDTSDGVFSISDVYTYADLTVNSLSLSASQVNNGQQITVTTTIFNQGNAVSGATNIKYYYSAISTGKDVYLGQNSVPSLNASGTASITTNVAIPSTSGLKGYIVAVVNPDYTVAESTTGNNLASASVIINDSFAPVIDYLLLSSYTVVKTGLKYSIAFSAKDNIGVESTGFYYSTDGNNWTTITSYFIPGSNGLSNGYEWMIPDTLAVPSSIYIKMVARDASGNVAEKIAGPYTLKDGTAPSITVLYPNGGEVFDIGSTQTIKWNVNAPNGVGNMDVYVYWGNTADVVAHPTNNGSGAYSWTIPNVSGYVTTGARIKIRVEDLNGNVNEDWSDEYFSIRDNSTPPPAPWHDPQVVTSVPPEKFPYTTKEDSTPVVATDSLGNVHLIYVYTQDDTSGTMNNTYPARTIIQKIFYKKLSNGAWSAPQEVYSRTQNTDGNLAGYRSFSNLRLRVDGNGYPHIVWHDEYAGVITEQNKNDIYYIYFNGSSWGAPINLSDNISGSQQLTSITWSTKANLPEVKSSAASAVVNGKLYVFGGNQFLTNYVYDPSANGWSRIADSPYYGVTDGGAAVINNKIYVVGDAIYYKQLKIYDPSTDSWATGPDMPTPRAYPSVAAVNGKLYVIGGWTSAKNEMYDPSTNIWTTKADMPSPRGLAAVAVVNDMIYVIGGRGCTSDICNQTEVYDPATNSWTTKTSMPSRRSSVVGSAVNNKIYVVGGFNGYTALNTIEEYDPVTDNWLTMTSMPTARLGMVAGAIGSKIYVAGGSNGTYNLSVTEEATVAGGGSATVSDMPSIAIDPSNNVHVVWRDGYSWNSNYTITGQSNLYYRKKDSAGNWSSVTQLTTGAGGARWPAFESDSYGNLHLAYKTDGAGIAYVKWDGVSWSSPTIISSQGEGEIDIAVRNNVPHVVWYYMDSAESKQKILYSRLDGTSWTAPESILNIYEGYPSRPSIVVDSLNRPHVFFEDGVNNKIGYSYKDQNGWSIPVQINKTTQVASGYTSSVALSPSDAIHAVWGSYYNSSQEVFYNQAVVAGSINDVTVPAVNVTSPMAGSLLTIGELFNITWSAKDNIGVSSIDIEYSIDNGASYNPIIANIANSGSYQWTVPQVNSSVAMIRVTAKDAAGNAGVGLSGVFSIGDKTSPTVLLSIPNGGEKWGNGSQQTIQWSATDNVGISGSDIYYSGDNGASWIKIGSDSSNSGSISWTVQANPTSAARIKIVVKDASGNISEDQSDWSFAIEASNKTPNLPGALSPLNNVSNVPANITLSWQGGDPDTADMVTYDVFFGTANPPQLVSSNQAVTAYSPGILENQKLYFWQIIAKDDKGNSTVGPLWSFVTESQLITTPVISVDRLNLIFNATYAGLNPSAQTLSISNAGIGTMNWIANTDASWLGLSQLNGTNNSVINVAADIAGLSPGMYKSNINISASGASNSPLQIPVTLYVTKPIPAGISNDQNDTGIEGVARSDGGTDANNIDPEINKPKIDLSYNFSIILKDPSGNPPQYIRLYMTNRSNPLSSDFYPVDLTCNGFWDAGATCGYPTLLGPAPNHKYYFEAKLADGNVLRYPTTGEIAGPVVELLNGYNMVSIPRDINGANMDGTAAFGSSLTYRWVSDGITTDSNKGGYALVDSNNPVKPGEGYFTMKGAGVTTLPEHGAYNDTLSPTYEIAVKPGWNMISNPYGGNVKLSDVQVQKGSNNRVSWTDAAASGYVVNAIYYYKGSDWGSAYTFESTGGNPDATLVPWFGYWVYLNKNDDTYKLVITRP